jgi:hypothetical protein
MKLVAVTRIMNEDDIVEAFIRHHAGRVDHHLLLDNGSIDRTIEILQALKSEGLEITVLQNKGVFFNERFYNTQLFLFAAREFAADWVLFLDTDEFIDDRKTPNGLHKYFETVPPDVNCLSLTSVQYFDTGHNLQDLLVPRRVRHREAQTGAVVTKVCIRGRLAGYVEIDAGQHSAIMHGKNLPTKAAETLFLAHYFRRGPYHLIWKSVLGRLKVLAAGKQELLQNRATHYTPIFEVLRDAPERLLLDAAWKSPPHDPQTLTDDPIHYTGGDLRYTQVSDDQMKAIRILLSYADGLATQFGSLMDTNEGVRLQVERNATRWARLF